MSVGAVILSILAILAGAASTVCLLGIMVVGAANMEPEPLAAHYRWMWIIGIGGLICLIAGIGLLVMRYPGWAGIIGAAPAALMVGALVWISIQTIFS